MLLMVAMLYTCESVRRSSITNQCMRSIVGHYFLTVTCRAAVLQHWFAELKTNAASPDICCGLQPAMPNTPAYQRLIVRMYKMAGDAAATLLLDAAYVQRGCPLPGLPHSHPRHPSGQKPRSVWLSTVGSLHH